MAGITAIQANGCLIPFYRYRNFHYKDFYKTGISIHEWPSLYETGPMLAAACKDRKYMFGEPHDSGF